MSYVRYVLYFVAFVSIIGLVAFIARPFSPPPTEFQSFATCGDDKTVYRFAKWDIHKIALARRSKGTSDYIIKTNESGILNLTPEECATITPID